MSKSFNLTAQINLQGPTNIKPIVADIRRQLGNINTNINVKFDAKAAKGVDVLSQKLVNLNRIILDVTKNSQILATSLNGVGSAVKGLGKINRVNTSLAQTNKSMVSTAKATKQAVSELEQFGKQAALAVRRFAAFSIVTTGVLSLANAIRIGGKAFIEFDKQLIRLQQVTGSGAVGIKLLQDEITSLAINLGVSSESLTEVAVTLAQAGLSARETQQALAALAKTELAPSFDNLTDTTEGAIAAIRQFNIETKDLEGVLGSINAVAAAFAVESSDIIAAIQRAGGAFAASSKGVSEGADALNEFIAIFTSVRATTRESAETIATGLRTIFTRIQRGSTIEFLKEFGVELTDIEDKFVGPFEAVKRLSVVLNALDPRDLRFSQIVEELGGFRQISKVIPLIQQFAEAEKALGVAQRGQNSLTEAQVKAQQSLANQIAKVREEFLALVRSLGQSQTFQGLFKLVLGLTSGLIKLAGVFKPILPLLAVLGAVKGGQAITKVTSGFIKGFRSGGGSSSGGGNITAPTGPGPTRGGTSTASNAVELADNTKSLVANTTSLDALTAAQNASVAAFANFSTSINNLGTSFVSSIDGLKDRLSTTTDYSVMAMRDLQNSLSSLTGLGDVVRSSADHVYDTMIGLTVAVRDLNNTIIQNNSGGGNVQGFARGGLVPGKGNRDTVPAMLTPGEFVIRKKAVETLGAGNLQKMNKYAAGGPVEISEFEQLRDGTSTVKSSYSNRIQPQDQVKGNINRLRVNFNDKNFPIDWEQLVKDTDIKYAELKQKSPEETDTYRLLNQASSLAFEQAVQQIVGGKITDLSYPVDIIRPKKDPVEVKFTKDPVSIKELLSKLYRYRAVRKSLGRYPFTTGIDDNPPIDIGKLDVVEMGPGQKQLYNSWYAENKDKILNKYLGGKIQKFAAGGKALGARPTIKELDETELAQLSTPQLIQYAKDLAYDVFTTGGAGMAIGSEFIEVPKEKIIPELESSLVSYMGKRGFWRETVAPFGRAIEQKTMDQSKLGREAALESQVSKYADEVAARSQEWTSIRSGSSIDNYLMQSLQEPILSDYQSSKAGQPLAKTFHATRLRQAVNKALDEFDDFDYSGSNIDKLVSGMAAKRFAFGGPVSADSGFEAIKKKIMDQYPDINFRISKRKGGFGYNVLGGLKQEGDNVGNYAEFKQAGNLSKLQEVADKMASSLLYEYGPNIDPSLLKKMQKKKFAKGGSTQDTVPALLTPGEFVINKKAAQKIGYSKLHSLNKADKLKGYNKGGVVGGIQKFATGGDVKSTQDWADAIRLLSQTTIPDFRSALEDVANQVEVLGKADVAKALRDIANNAKSSDDAVSRLGGSQRNANVLKSNSVLDPSGNVIDLRPGLDALAAVIEKNVKAQELFSLSAEQAGMSIKEFEQNIKTQILERSLSGEAGRKTSRLDLRKEFVKTRLRFNPSDLRDADNQQQVRESLQTSLSGLLDPAELNDALDEIIYGLGTGSKSLEEIAAVSPEVAKALDSARDRADAMSRAHKELEDELGGLTDAVKVSAEELQVFDYKKSGRAQQEFGLLGVANPAAALSFKNSNQGGSVLATAQRFQKTAFLDKLPLVGKNIDKLADSLENLPGPIGQAIKAIGGLPGAFAAASSILGSEILPTILKNIGQGDSEIGAGTSGALAQGGSYAASLGTLGNQLAGPIGGLIGVIGGAIGGGIKGFFEGFETKALENSLKRLSAQTDNVEKAFDFLSKKNTGENFSNAQREVGKLTANIKDLQAQSQRSVSERAADTGAFAAFGAAIGGTLGLVADIYAGGLTGGAGTVAGAGIGASVGGGLGAGGFFGYSDADNEALLASLDAAERYVTGLQKLGDIKIQLSSLEDLNNIVDGYNDFSKNLDEQIKSGALTPDQAIERRASFNEQLGRTRSVYIEQAQRSALMNAGRVVDPNRSLNEQFAGDQASLDIAQRAADDAALSTAMEELRRKYGQNEVAIRKEMKDRDKLIKRGYELSGQMTFQQASAQRLAEITRKVAMENENLVEKYNKALAAIQRITDGIDNLIQGAEFSSGLLTGQARAGQSDRTQEQMLRNMSAYTADELRPVLENVSNLAGGGQGGQQLTDAILANKTIQEKLPDILRNADARNVTDVTGEISQALELAGIGDGVRKALVEEIQNSLGEETRNRQGKGFQDILSDFQAFSDTLNTTKKAQDVGIALLQAQNDTIDKVNKQLDVYNEQLKRSAEWSRKADEIRLEGALALDRVLGRNISLERLNAPFNTEIRSLTQDLPGGATTDPVAIAEGIRQNRAAIEAIVGKPGETIGSRQRALDQGNEEEAEKLSVQLADLTRSSDDAYEALEKLATNGNNAANVLSKIEDNRQLGRNVVDFARRVSTQSSEESINMQRSFIALERAFDGSLNFGNRQERQLAFEGLDTLLPLIKGTEEGNKILQRVTENMLAGQGVALKEPFGNTGMTVRDLIKAGTTGTDANTTALIKTYERAIAQQENAAIELSKLNKDAAKQVTLESIESILQGLVTALPKIVEEQLRRPPKEEPAAPEEPKEPLNAPIPAPASTTDTGGLPESNIAATIGTLLGVTGTAASVRRLATARKAAASTTPSSLEAFKTMFSGGTKNAPAVSGVLKTAGKGILNSIASLGLKATQFDIASSLPLKDFGKNMSSTSKVALDAVKATTPAADDTFTAMLTRTSKFGVKAGAKIFKLLDPLLELGAFAYNPNKYAEASMAGQQRAQTRDWGGFAYDTAGGGLMGLVNSTGTIFDGIYQTVGLMADTLNAGIGSMGSRVSGPSENAKKQMEFYERFYDEQRKLGQQQTITPTDSMRINNASLTPEELARKILGDPAFRKQYSEQNTGALPDVTSSNPLPVSIVSIPSAPSFTTSPTSQPQPVATPDTNFAIFDSLAMNIKNLDLTLLNTVNNSINNLTSSISSLSTRFNENSNNDSFGRTFNESTTAFGTKVDVFNTSTSNFGSYVDKLSEAVGSLSNAKITMGGNYTVDVRVSGAAAFQSIEEKTQQLIDKQIGLAMDDLNKKIADATGMSIDLRRRKV